MKRVQIKFRNAALDVYTNEDGTIEAITNHDVPAYGLLFDLGHMDDIQTLTSEAIAEQDMESAQHAVESAREIEK